MNPVPRKWLRRLIVLVLTLTTLGFIAWRGLTWFVERTEPFAGFPLPSCGTISASNFTDAIAQARHQVQAMMVERQIPGLAVAVARDGQLIWSEGFGYADREKQTPACPHTQFRIASVSKLITAAAMAQLYEQGRLDLDAPIQKYVPTFPDKGHPITARQLASHRSGIRTYYDDSETVTTQHYNSVTASLERFQNDPLMFEPDTESAYSSYGYVLLSAVIEGAAGEDFLSYVRRQIFEPLAMRSTVACRSDTMTPHQSSFYDNVTPYSLDGQVHPSPFIDYSSKWASGGFLSRAEDLVKFGSAHIPPMNSGFLKAATLDLLFTPRTPRIGIVGQGLGWMSLFDLHLRRVHLHFGATSGGTAVLINYPQQQLSVAILANLGHAKFPFARLMGVVNPFLSDPSRYVVVGFVLIWTSIGALVLVRRLRKRST
ncbi:MAG TPA: serine hydrolase domain-containing protein [bacterium]